MDIVAPRICEKHKKQANQMCTKYQCFLDSDILICPDCSSKHFAHRTDTIDISLLNEKVHFLMKKRVEFEEVYDKSCQALINELKKFKMFKEELFNSLNIRERILNELCKKMKKKVPYEKDKQLFKSHFGYVYLTMKGINPNLDIYNKFKVQIAETIASCRTIFRKFQLNCTHTDIPILARKQYQISTIIKKTKENGEMNEMNYFTPEFNKFKKETVKYKGQRDKNCKLMRINDKQFISIQGDCLSWCNINNFLFPKTVPLGKKLSDIAIIDKNAFITTEQAGILIYDLIHEKVLKQYASSNHKNASITGLLSINHSTVLNFITCPNQIVSLKFNQQAGTLKVSKGVETESKELDAKLLNDNFITLYDNKVVNIYKTEYLDKQGEYTFENLMKTSCVVTDNVFAVAGQCNVVSVLDTRQPGCVLKMMVNDYCNNIAKIYPYSLLLTCGKALKIYDIRKNLEIFNKMTQENIKNVEVLSSKNFITCASSMTWWESVSEVPV